MISTQLRMAMLAVLVVPAGMNSPVFAQPQAVETRQEQPGTISVTGEGDAAVAPDMALVTLTVLREAETARQALDDSNEAMEEVLQAMRDEDIAERDLQTSGFGINPQYVYPNGENEVREPRITGYEVSNTLTVRLRDLEKLGALLDASVSLGVNQGGNIVFTNNDPAQTLAEAREDAVGDARARAETLADAAGVSLGRILRIDESTQAPPPMPMARAEMAKSFAADASVPVASGENLYHVTVTMTFEIDEDAE
ncbi:SIMPL domain-containing protein [Pararhizobium haloflavum]|uniref:SIMPL domain-containing protein n=1 Tax=Pararhizobium haloflavum TaxID=2037914 RepID=UPI000C18B96C|nr:SIMPL domain-containing protein [Pararhizobium haloflavum]